jgi:hypothetical protein
MLREPIERKLIVARFPSIYRLAVLAAFALACGAGAKWK